MPRTKAVDQATLIEVLDTLNQKEDTQETRKINRRAKQRNIRVNNKLSEAVRTSQDIKHLILRLFNDPQANHNTGFF